MAGTANRPTRRRRRPRRPAPGIMPAPSSSATSGCSRSPAYPGRPGLAGRQVPHPHQGAVDAPVGLQRGEVAPRRRRADGGQLRLRLALRLAGTFGVGARGCGRPRPGLEHRFGRGEPFRIPAHDDDLDGEPGRAERRPTAPRESRPRADAARRHVLDFEFVFPQTDRRGRRVLAEVLHRVARPGGPTDRPGSVGGGLLRPAEPSSCPRSEPAATISCWRQL